MNSGGLLPIIVMSLVLLFSGTTIGTVGKVVVVVIGNLASTAQGYSGRIGRSVSWLRVLWETTLWSMFWLALLLSSRVSEWIGFVLGMALLLALLVKALRPPAGGSAVPTAAN